MTSVDCAVVSSAAIRVEVAFLQSRSIFLSGQQLDKFWAGFWRPHNDSTDILPSCISEGNSLATSNFSVPSEACNSDKGPFVNQLS